MSDDAKLQNIQERVREASTRNARRLADRAGEARDSATAFVSEHPLAALASGIAVGAAIAVLLPRRRAEKVEAEPDHLKTNAVKWAALAAEAALAFVQQGLDSARTAGQTGQQKLEDLGERVSDGTAGLRKDIGRFTEEAAHNVRAAGEQASQQAKSVAGRIGSRFRS